MNIVLYSQRRTALAKARRSSTLAGLPVVHVFKVGRRTFAVAPDGAAIKGALVATARAGRLRYRWRK